MIAKRTGLMIVAVMLATTCFATDSNAAQQWYTCNVNMTGPGGDSVFVQLTSSPAFTNKWFLVPTSNAKEILATALTAISNEKQVYVCADLSQSGYPTIFAFYIIK
jgi:hypothetical protein